MKKLCSLFLMFFKIGAFTFGGGYAMIALLENEFITRRHWMTQEEFLDMTAIAESTPGACRRKQRHLPRLPPWRCVRCARINDCCLSSVLFDHLSDLSFFRSVSEPHDRGQGRSAAFRYA